MKSAPPRWLNNTVVVIVLVLILITCALRLARAHEFYYVGCCGDKDCRPVPCGEIGQSGRGYEYHGMTTRPSAHMAWIVFPSPDGRCHVCIGQVWGVMSYLRCLYLPRFLS